MKNVSDLLSAHITVSVQITQTEACVCVRHYSITSSTARCWHAVLV